MTETIIQQCLSDEQIEEMLQDLRGIDNPEEHERWELALSFTPEDLDTIIERLEEVVDG